MNRCFDCAYCSTYALSPMDVCDLDEHIISNAYNEFCDDFARVEEERNEL